MNNWHVVCLDCDVKGFSQDYPTECSLCESKCLMITDLRFTSRWDKLKEDEDEQRCTRRVPQRGRQNYSA